MENANPIVRNKTLPTYETIIINGKLKNVSSETIYEILRGIKDPEHPYTLEELQIINLDDISVLELSNKHVVCRSGQPINCIEVIFTPTIPHCSMAGIIGLAIIYKLMKFIDGHVISVKIKEDTHNTYKALNKQFSDNDRVFAAFENDGLLEIIGQCVGEN